MRDFNRIILMGRLGQEPVRRQTKDGKSVVNFSLATARWVREEQAAMPESSAGERPRRTEETDWHRIVVWGRQADACAEYLGKGDAVLVEGGVRTRKYDGKDGVQRTSFEVHADLVRFLGGRSFRREASDTSAVEPGGSRAIEPEGAPVAAAPPAEVAVGAA